MPKKFKNAHSFSEWLESFEEKQIKSANELIEAYAQRTVRDAKRKAPVDTGYLEGSIDYQIKTTGNGLIEATVFVGAEYGYWVEFGTSTHYAQPFLYPAFLTYSERFLKTLSKATGQNLKD